MTTETAQGMPTFPSRSRGSQLARDVFVVALCAAIVGGFLAHVWRAPEPAGSAVASASQLEHRS